MLIKEEISEIYNKKYEEFKKSIESHYESQIPSLELAR
jgi:hypothetical protein